MVKFRIRQRFRSVMVMTVVWLAVVGYTAENELDSLDVSTTSVNSEKKDDVSTPDLDVWSKSSDKHTEQSQPKSLADAKAVAESVIESNIVNNKSSSVVEKTMVETTDDIGSSTKRDTGAITSTLDASKYETWKSHEIEQWLGSLEYSSSEGQSRVVSGWHSFVRTVTESMSKETADLLTGMASLLTHLQTDSLCDPSYFLKDASDCESVKKGLLLLMHHGLLLLPSHSPSVSPSQSRRITDNPTLNPTMIRLTGKKTTMNPVADHVGLTEKEFPSKQQVSEMDTSVSGADNINDADDAIAADSDSGTDHVKSGVLTETKQRKSDVDDSNDETLVHSDQQSAVVKSETAGNEEQTVLKPKYASGTTSSAKGAGDEDDDEPDDSADDEPPFVREKDKSEEDKKDENTNHQSMDQNQNEKESNYMNNADNDEESGKFQTQIDSLKKVVDLLNEQVRTLTVKNEMLIDKVKEGEGSDETKKEEDMPGELVEKSQTEQIRGFEIDLVTETVGSKLAGPLSADIGGSKQMKHITVSHLQINVDLPKVEPLVVQCLSSLSESSSNELSRDAPYLNVSVLDEGKVLSFVWTLTSAQMTTMSPQSLKISIPFISGTVLQSLSLVCNVDSKPMVLWQHSGMQLRNRELLTGYGFTMYHGMVIRSHECQSVTKLYSLDKLQRTLAKMNVIMQPGEFSENGEFEDGGSPSHQSNTKQESLTTTATVKVNERQEMLNFKARLCSLHAVIRQIGNCQVSELYEVPYLSGGDEMFGQKEGGFDDQSTVVNGQEFDEGNVFDDWGVGNDPSVKDKEVKNLEYGDGDIPGEEDLDGVSGDSDLTKQGSPQWGGLDDSEFIKSETGDDTSIPGTMDDFSDDSDGSQRSNTHDDSKKKNSRHTMDDDPLIGHDNNHENNPNNNNNDDGYFNGDDSGSGSESNNSSGTGTSVIVFMVIVATIAGGIIYCRMKDDGRMNADHNSSSSKPWSFGSPIGIKSSSDPAMDRSLKQEEVELGQGRPLTAQSGSESPDSALQSALDRFFDDDDLNDSDTNRGGVSSSSKTGGGRGGSSGNGRGSNKHNGGNKSAIDRGSEIRFDNSGSVEAESEAGKWMVQLLVSMGYPPFACKQYVRKLNDYYVTSVDQLKVMDDSDWSQMGIPPEIVERIERRLHEQDPDSDKRKKKPLSPTLPRTSATKSRGATVTKLRPVLDDESEDGDMFSIDEDIHQRASEEEENQMSTVQRTRPLKTGDARFSDDDDLLFDDF